MQKTATFSPDRKYRYTLHRIWNESKPLLAFIMCNPSTADENILDPTVTRCFNFAGKWGEYGGLVVGNIFALRSTDPKGLLKDSDPIGPDNNNALRDIAEQAGKIIVAWGSFSVLGSYMKQRAEAVKNLLHDFDLYANLGVQIQQGWQSKTSIVCQRRHRAHTIHTYSTCLYEVRRI